MSFGVGFGCFGCFGVGCETCQDCGVVEVDVPCDARCEWATGQHHTVEVDCPCCSEDAWEDKE